MSDNNKRKRIPDMDYALKHTKCVSNWELDKKLNGAVHLICELQEQFDEMPGADKFDELEKKLERYHDQFIQLSNRVHNLIESGNIRFSAFDHKLVEDRECWKAIGVSVDLIKQKCENFHEEIGANQDAIKKSIEPRMLEFSANIARLDDRINRIEEKGSEGGKKLDDIIEAVQGLDKRTNRRFTQMGREVLLVKKQLPFGSVPVPCRCEYCPRAWTKMYDHPVQHWIALCDDCLESVVNAN